MVQPPGASPVDTPKGKTESIPVGGRTYVLPADPPPPEQAVRDAGLRLRLTNAEILFLVVDSIDRTPGEN
jgi:hypothetical protein